MGCLIDGGVECILVGFSLSYYFAVFLFLPDHLLQTKVEWTQVILLLVQHNLRLLLLARLLSHPYLFLLFFTKLLLALELLAASLREILMQSVEDV